MDEQKTDSFFKIVEEVIKNGDTSQEYLDKLNDFTNDFRNFNKCKEMLENEDNSIYIKTFASGAILRMVVSNISSWKIEYSIQLCDWSIECMRRDCLKLGNNILTSLAQIVAIILCYFWVKSSDECMKEWKEIIEIFDDGPNEWIPALFLITAIYDQIDNSNESQTISLFSEKCLRESFKLAYDVTKRIRNLSKPKFDIILDLSLNYLEKCLSNRMSSNGFYHESFEEQVDFYFEIYNNFCIFPALKCLYAIVKSLGNVASVGKSTGISIIDNQALFQAVIIDQLCFGFINLLDGKTGDINEDHFNYIFMIIAEMAKYLNFSVISQMPQRDKFKMINNFISMMAAITNILMEQFPNHYLITIQNAISFFVNISKALNNDGNVEPKKILSNFAPQLCFNYVGLLLSILNDESKVETADFHSKSLNFQGDGNIPADDKLCILNDKITPFVLPIQQLVILSPQVICHQLLQGLLEKQKEFTSNLASSAEMNSSELQLAFFIEVATVVVSIKSSSSSFIDPKIEFHPDFFAQLMTILHQSENWAVRGLLFPRLEMSLQLFISQFKNTLFGPSNSKTQLSKKLYDKLKKKRSVSSFDDCQSYLFHRTMVTLRFYDEPFLVNQALSIVHSSNKIIPSKNTLSLIFSSPLDHSFPFINKIENVFLRSRFISTMFSIIIDINKANKCLCPYFTDILKMLDVKFENINVDNILESDETKKDICFLAVDICGIFNETKDNFTFDRLFEWFILNDKPKLFNKTFSMILKINSPNDDSDEFDDNEGSNDLVINLILKMWKSIVLCTPPNRIQIGQNSPNGVILFKLAADLLIQYFNYIEIYQRKELKDAKIKGIKYSFLILQNLMSGMYVPFEAFKIYNDTIFIRLLNSMLKMMSNESFFKIIGQYPSTFSAMIHLFKDLLFHQIDLVIEKAYPLFLLIIENSIKILANISDDENCNNLYSDHLVLDIISIFLQHFYDMGLEYQVNLVEKINFTIWNKILRNEIGLKVDVLKPLKFLFLLNEQSLSIILEKIKLNVSPQNFAKLQTFFSNLKRFYLINDSEITNAVDIINCFRNIIDILHQCPPIYFV